MVIAGFAVLAGVICLIIGATFWFLSKQIHGNQAAIYEIGKLLTSQTRETNDQLTATFRESRNMLSTTLIETMTAIGKELYGERNAAQNIETPIEVENIYKSNWMEELPDYDPATYLENDPISPEFRPDIVSTRANGPTFSIFDHQQPDLAGEQYGEEQQ